MTSLISRKISSILSVSSSWINWLIFMNDGAFIPSNSHMYRMSVLHSLLILRTDAYPFSINANNMIFSIFTPSYLGRPTLLSFSTKYFLRSIRSTTSLKLYTGSSISMSLSTSIGILSCFGVQLLLVVWFFINFILPKSSLAFQLGCLFDV